jgi:DNA repair photolyase
MEPRTAGPQQRLNMLGELASRGIPTGALAAPIIPGLNDHELEQMLAPGAQRGACSAGYVLLRLPHEVEGTVQRVAAPSRSRGEPCCTTLFATPRRIALQLDWWPA